MRKASTRQGMFVIHDLPDKKLFLVRDLVIDPEAEHDGMPRKAFQNFAGHTSRTIGPVVSRMGSIIGLLFLPYVNGSLSLFISAHEYSLLMALKWSGVLKLAHFAPHLHF